MTRLSLPGSQRWAVLMMSGGHFAGAIFSGGTPVVHKTFHSYTTRRGQGQSQATRDQHGNAPRRYPGGSQDVPLVHDAARAGSVAGHQGPARERSQHVQEIITGWSEDLSGCSLILYRAVGPINQGIIFGKSSPLRKDDLRVRQLPFPTRKPSYKEVQRSSPLRKDDLQVRQLPFPTRKPSYKEVQRVHETVASLEIYGKHLEELPAAEGRPASEAAAFPDQEAQL
ncbi:Ankyrin repeat and zinc finger domain-containing protein 1 [Operophtera brumata]|uniref:Ankyrin repeat and zinc finger domain-containing protein 1 n=1 Tax=Operophtera brumata TaxID=104452 RepID=A0A0L7LM52_OPEBR|nr:Ankyrin repeat and zinc finger domain-containing protein 1 [Operophtera brumata]